MINASNSKNAAAYRPKGASVSSESRYEIKGRYCALIPALNAEKTIQKLIHEIKKFGLSVVVINDGSDDRTASIASKEGAFVISHLTNQGKGCSLRAGFNHILGGAYDGVITIDSDGQHDPQDVLKLIEVAEKQHAAIVVGNRMGSSGAMPFLRRWTNTVMSLIISKISSQSIPDSQCGLRLIRKEVLASINLNAKRYEIESEILLEASRHKWKTVSVPIKTIYLADHQSHIKPIRDTFRFLKVIFSYFLRLKSTRSRNG